jgi:hypothetical protein
MDGPTPALPRLCVSVAFPPCLALALAVAQPLPQVSPAAQATAERHPPNSFPTGSEGEDKDQISGKKAGSPCPTSGPGLNSLLLAAQSQSVLYLPYTQVVAQTDLEACREKTAGMHLRVSRPHSPGHTA